MKPHVWLAAAVVGLGLSPAIAADPPKAAPKTLAEKVAALQKQANAAQQAYFDTAARLQKELKGENYQSAENKSVLEKRDAAFQTFAKAQGEIAGQIADLAKENPKDPAAIEAIVASLSIHRQNKTNLKPLLAIATEHHLSNPALYDLIDLMMYDNNPDGAAFLKSVTEKGSGPMLKGAALYAMGFRLKQQLIRYGRPATDEEIAKLSPQADAIFNEVVEKYGKVLHQARVRTNNRTLGQNAADQLAGLRNIPLLRVGKVAPDIEGEDVDGKAFKLSDYRGKVVMLDFWGDW